MKGDRSWLPGATELDWIESLAAPLSDALAAIEAAAAPDKIPIVDRDSGRALAALAAGRRRIVEVGTPTATRPSGWPSASRPTGRSSRSIRIARGPTSPAAGGARRGSPTRGSRS